jgi:hypothetical protein
MDIVHWVFDFIPSLLQIKQIMPSGIYFCQAAKTHSFDFQVKNPSLNSVEIDRGNSDWNPFQFDYYWKNHSK